MKSLSKNESSQNTVLDHRQGNRHRALVLVEIRWRDDHSVAGLIYNISRDGMFIVSKARPGVNKCVDVVLPVLDGTRIQIPGVIVHHNNNGFGLLFQQQNSAIQSFVEKYLAHADSSG